MILIQKLLVEKLLYLDNNFQINLTFLIVLILISDQNPIIDSCLLRYMIHIETQGQSLHTRTLCAFKAASAAYYTFLCCSCLPPQRT